MWSDLIYQDTRGRLSGKSLLFSLNGWLTSHSLIFLSLYLEDLIAFFSCLWFYRVFHFCLNAYHFLALKSSRKHARMLEGKILKHEKGGETSKSQPKKARSTESDLLQHWTSLFRHTEDTILCEIVQAVS